MTDAAPQPPYHNDESSEQNNFEAYQAYAQAQSGQQATQQPANIPGMPLLYLTGGMKFGWAVLGVLLGPVAILIAWLTNAHNFPQAKKESVRYSLIGFLCSIALMIFCVAMVSCAACAVVGTYID